jgi:hypothetical protein
MLARVPLWGWFLVMTLATYWMYNPVASVYQLWTSTAVTTALPWKLLITAATTTFFGLVILETKRNIGFFGVAIILTLVGLFGWGLYTSAGLALFHVEILQWLIQIVISCILTVGWQWPKIWRSATGTVTTLTPDTGADSHHTT